MKNKIKAIFSLVLVIAITIISNISVFASEAVETSVEYRFENNFNLSKLLYGDFALLSDEYCPVPGLEITDVAGEKCNCMTPQGLCVTDDFILISAYCNIKNYKSDLEDNLRFGDNEEKLEAEKDHKKHNSVIYIIDRITGEYIKNIVLPDTNHVGGLCTDGKNIYVAKSTDAQISVITFDQLELVLATKSKSVKIDYAYTVSCGCTASFVTYYDGLLWVGVFNEKDSGEMNAFYVNKKDFTLSQKLSIEIPSKANGASFTEIDGDVCLSVNSSYGRKNPSTLYLYSVSSYGTNEMQLHRKDIYILPPTIQNSCIFDGKYYHMYESAATCYSLVDSVFDIKSTVCSVDRVCISDVEKLFSWQSDENMCLVKIQIFFDTFKKLIENLILI